MMSRLAKLPVIACACLFAGVVIGLILAPASAQQLAPIDGQVAVRSDYAVYLISGGQRRWIATVVISDEEINAYPEGEPVYTGLSPQPAQGPASAAPSPAPALPQPAAVPPAPGMAAPAPAPAPAPAAPAAAVPAPGAPAGAVAPGPAPAAYPTPNGAVGEIDPLLPIEVDIDGTPVFEQGNQIGAVMRSKSGASCELTVRWPDATETVQPPQAADARGRCTYSVRVPPTVPNGQGSLKGTVREGGRVSNQTVEFEITTDVD
jgi:hypothetical protein